MDFHEFFKYWMRGEVECGDYFDWCLSWWEHKDDPNNLFILYEDMKSDPHKEIMRMAAFIGREYAEKLSANNNKILEKIVKETSFSETKEQLIKSSANQSGETSVNVNARKGIIGDWKNHMNDHESLFVDQKFHQKFSGTGLDVLWNHYDIFGPKTWK